MIGHDLMPRLHLVFGPCISLSSSLYRQLNLVAHPSFNRHSDSPVWSQPLECFRVVDVRSSKLVLDRKQHWIDQDDNSDASIRFVVDQIQKKKKPPDAFEGLKITQNAENFPLH